MKTTRSILSLLAMAGLLCGATASLGADLYVSGSGSYDDHEAYTDLRQAIWEAKTGDTVWVENGFVCDSGVTETSEGATRVFTDKAITVRSRSGSLENPAIIRGKTDRNGAGGRFGPDSIRCLQIQNANCVFIGFRFEDGSVRSGEAKVINQGGGILGWGRLRSCLVTGNSARRGGGISSYVGSIVFESCVISNNFATDLAGGTFAGVGLDSRIVCNVSANESGGFNGTTLTNCLIDSNIAGLHGGGGKNIALPLTRCIISNNVAGGNGGGVAFSPILDHCLVISNTAGGNGGGVFGWAPTARAVATGTSFIGNRASGSGGGAMNIRGADCRFEGNAATVDGGGAHDAILTDCVVWKNESVCDPASKTGRGNGGGLSNCTATNCLITLNRASCGGEYIQDKGYGGGAYGHSGASGLVHCIITNNVADSRGGGLSLCDSSHCVIMDNEVLSSRGEGGGVMGGEHFNSLITGNRCKGNGGGAGWETLLVNCTLRDNTGRTPIDYTRMVNTAIDTPETASTIRIHWATNCCSPIAKLESVGYGNKIASPKLGTEGSTLHVPLPGSPCLDGGVTFCWMANEADVRSRDLRGRKRVIGPSVDIGAFEAPYWGTKLFIR